MKADCHIHMIMDTGPFRAAVARHQRGPDEAYIRALLARYRERGFTYLRDGGDRWGVTGAAKALAGEEGITYRTPLAPLHRVGHYGGFLGQGFSSAREFCGLVREHRRNGADFIKIMISGLMDFRAFGVLTEEGLPAAEIRELVSICHGEGFSVMAHANGARTVEAAAAAGVDSIEHGAYLDAEALAAMAACGTVWVPTLSTVANLRRTGRYDDGVLDAILDSFYENLHAYCALGGLLAPGTDAGAPAVPHAGETELALLAPFPLAPGTQTLMERF